MTTHLDTNIILSSLSVMTNLSKSLETNYKITKKSGVELKDQKAMKNVKDQRKTQQHQQQMTHLQR